MPKLKRRITLLNIKHFNNVAKTIKKMLIPEMIALADRKNYMDKQNFSKLNANIEM